MYLCICHQISDIDLDTERRKYPHLPDYKILEKLGLGSDCGTCLNTPKNDSINLVSRCSKIKSKK